MTVFNTPEALAREPWTAAFWAVCAPFLFPALVGLVFGGAADGSLQAAWTLLCLSTALQFGLISLWSEYLGAGAFAGSMRASPGWLLLAVGIGPVLLIGPSILAGMIMQGREDWQYSGAIDERVFDPGNWTLGYLVFVAVLAPLVEEVTYRGVALGTLVARGVKPGLAAVLTSAAFALIHLQYSPMAMLVVFAAGMGFAALRLLSGSMLVPIVAHMAANCVVLLLQSAAAGAA